MVVLERSYVACMYFFVVMVTRALKKTHVTDRLS